MGHHFNTVRAVGRDREEAERQAWSDFLYENGHRHSERGVESAKLIRKVPPKKQVECDRPMRSFYGSSLYTREIRMEDDPTAPLDQWMEEWEFELHTHA